MKRVLVLALALMFVGIMTYADNPAPVAKWSLWSEGDLYLDTSDGNWGWGPGWTHMGNEAKGWYTTLGVSYDGNNYGYMAQLEFGADMLAALSGTYTTVNGNNGTSILPIYLFRQFNAYYKMFDGAVKITAGKIMDFEYTPVDYVEGDNLTSWFGSSGEGILGTSGSPSQNEWTGDFGAMLQLYPVQGASLGVGVAVPGTATIGYWSKGAAINYSKALSFAGSYAIPDLAKINVLFRTNGSVLGVNGTFTGVKNLSVLAGFESGFDVGLSGQQQYIAGMVSAQYVMAPLTVGLSAWDCTPTYSGAPTDFSVGSDWGVEGMVEYVVWSNISVGARVGYENTFGGAIPLSGWMTGNVDGFTVYPYVTAKFDNGSSVQIGFQWTSGVTGVSNAQSTTAWWGIPIKFVVAF